MFLLQQLCRSRPVDRAVSVSGSAVMGSERDSLIRLTGVVLECSPITHIRIHALIPDFCGASPHSVPSELAFIIPAGNHLEI